VLLVGVGLVIAFLVWYWRWEAREAKRWAERERRILDVLVDYGRATAERAPEVPRD
jgi:hypothetical protein